MTVDEAQSRVAALVDQDEDTANISSGDYSLRLDYLNRRERAWAEITDWRVLFAEYNTQTSTNSGNVTITLPSDFRKPAGYPMITYDGASTEEFVEIQKQKQGRFVSSDRYVYYLGNEADSYSMIVHPGTETTFLASGASLYVPYYKSPASLASPADLIACPNPDYMIKSVVGDIWESREDARFQQIKIEAEQILANMLQRETIPSEAAQDRFVRTTDELRYGFRWGKD
jgi:hypothetical protein